MVLWACMGAAIQNVNAAEMFVSFGRTADNQLQLTQTSDTIIYSDADWEGVKIAVRNLRNDLKAVTGSECAPIIVGTVDKSLLANKYKKQSKHLKGKWEQYLLFTDKGKLVILGSDKRGTIYGIYELSRQIGVSPWYWMTDVPIAQHNELYINDGMPQIQDRLMPGGHKSVPDLGQTFAPQKRYV